MNEAFKHAMTIYDETSAKNEGFRKIYADLSKFRADQNLWFRFTEATFDRFMQAQKAARSSCIAGPDPQSMAPWMPPDQVQAGSSSPA